MLVARYIRIFRRVPNMRHPRTFNEHVLAKLLFDRDPRLRLFADKFGVRAFVEDRLGGTEHLTTLYAVIDEPTEIRRLALPDRFVMKPTHMSGAFEIVRDATSVDRRRLETRADAWLRRNYGIERGEWAYTAIVPRVLFEELLEHNGELAIDYNFYCFGGEPRFIRVTREQHGPIPIAAVYDTDFRLMPVTLVRTWFRQFTEHVPPPPNYPEMLKIARRLSEGTDFLRVDLYNVGGRIVFGELTNYPHAGTRKWDPPIWESVFGGYWPSRRPRA
jgi:TupA-like ATPgrasp